LIFIILFESPSKIELACLKNQDDELYFYFLGVPTTDLFYILPKKLKFKKISLLASNLHNYIYDSDIKPNSINDCYRYFNSNSEYTIDNFDAELENQVYIGSHDNTEIHIKFPKTFNYKRIIYKLLEKYQYDPQKVIELLINTYTQFNDYRKKTQNMGR
jgi:hypothetical protein